MLIGKLPWYIQNMYPAFIDMCEIIIENCKIFYYVDLISSKTEAIPGICSPRKGSVEKLYTCLCREIKNFSQNIQIFRKTV